MAATTADLQGASPLPEGWLAVDIRWRLRIGISVMSPPSADSALVGSCSAAPAPPAAPAAYPAET